MGSRVISLQLRLLCARLSRDHRLWCTARSVWGTQCLGKKVLKHLCRALLGVFGVVVVIVKRHGDGVGLELVREDSVSMMVGGQYCDVARDRPRLLWDIDRDLWDSMVLLGVEPRGMHPRRVTSGTSCSWL